jgi:hypothetical protein
MNVVTITNVKQLPGKSTLLCVQAANDADALRSLRALATKRGDTLGETVYRHGTYFYAPLKAKEGMQS